MKRDLLSGVNTTLFCLLFVLNALCKIYGQGSFILMLLFTLYISYMLAFAYNSLRFSDGEFKQLKWNQHLSFNVILIVLALCGLCLNRKNTVSKNRISHSVIYRNPGMDI